MFKQPSCIGRRPFFLGEKWIKTNKQTVKLECAAAMV